MPLFARHYNKILLMPKGQHLPQHVETIVAGTFALCHLQQALDRILSGMGILTKSVPRRRLLYSL